MKIVELISSLDPVGGAQTLVSDLCLKFSKKHDVFLICLYNCQNCFLSQKLINEGIKVIFLNKKKGVDLTTARELRKILKDIKPDIIHAHLNTFLTLFLSKTMKMFKVFYTFHSEANKTNSGSKIKPENILLRFLSRSHRFEPIAISELVKKSLMLFYGFKNLHVVPNGVDLDRYNFGCDENKRDIDFVVVGSFSKNKNQLFILESFKIAQMSNKSINLTFVGDGECRKQCEQYVADNRLTGVTFVGVVDDTSSLIKRSKVLCMASNYEGNPMVINEAIACGTYVLSNNVGGIPDLIKNNKIGCMLESKDFCVSNYALKMNEILNNYHGIFSEIKKNNSKYSQDVSIENTIKCYLRIFDCR
jgi:glycosyltransferase involved in cell wall biosynthesis